MADMIISLVSAVAIVVVVRAACRREREAERLQRLNAWQHWPAPQGPAELEQQALALRACSPARASALGVAGSREAREWAKRHPELAREVAEVVAGHD